MHLALDVSWTQVESAWRTPGSWVGRHYPDVGLFEDSLEEIFEATGSRGGFMLGHSQCGPRDQLQSIVDLLVSRVATARSVSHRLYRPHLARKSSRLNGGKMDPEPFRSWPHPQP
jgi:hypothetical protein